MLNIGVLDTWITPDKLYVAIFWFCLLFPHQLFRGMLQCCFAMKL